MPYGCDTFSVCPEEGLSEVEAPSRRTRRSIDVLRDAISTSSMATQDKRPICRDRPLNDFSVEADGLPKYFGDYKAVAVLRLAVPQSEERPVGKECVSSFNFPGWPYK